ncbi:uncharacterized protein C8A04DRAFT_30632 [Dichotomopilus funicola]|uniref:Uncharacterized protein n=1 Tax=Dichotomopilus funicola TaxID=1934379 RepID=A0AAN6ZKG8_9PEZI|nr:hypothetical protein C8A04DRAFT_30632 [Dichotomopilus funicola]
MPSLTTVAMTFLPVMATAFGTINDPIVLKQHNEHEMITRLAFQCAAPNQKSDGTCFEPRSLDQLAGYHNNVMGIALTGTGMNGAVGAPDTFDPLPEGPEAHCDDADFLDVPGYPQSRKEANARLQTCVDHLRHRFRQAVDAARRLVDERNRIRREMVQISYGGDCTFAFPTWQSDSYGRAKCSAIEGFGRALHGIQDFYAHSNWADAADPTQEISISNPPGLGMTETAPFLDLRANGTIPEEQIPRNLTTGCFNLPDITFGSGVCQGRITHNALSKDKGIIHLDGTFGSPEADPRSEAVSTNFELAVKAAVKHSQEAWGHLRDEIRQQYGAISGDIMICSLIRDDPIKDCRNRTMVLAVDNSFTAGASGAVQLEESLAEEITSRLNQEGRDTVAIIDNHKPAVVRYPMGSPVHAAFNFPPPSGEICLASGLELGIAETIHAQPETYSDRGAIVLLSTSAERPEFTRDTLAQLKRAAEEGIRVHYACIDMHPPSPLPLPPTEDGLAQVEWTPCSPSDALVSPVLKTGGIVAFVDVSTARRRIPAHFANLVMDRGLTATDDDGDEGEEEGGGHEHTRIYPGITLADILSPDHPEKSFVYPVTAGERLQFTVSSIALPNNRDDDDSENWESSSSSSSSSSGENDSGSGVSGAEACFTVTLWHDYAQTEIATHTRCGDSSPLTLGYEAGEGVELVLEAEYGGAGLGEVFGGQREEILFVLSVDTSLGDKADTIATTAGREKTKLDSADKGSRTSTSAGSDKAKVTDEGGISVVRSGLEYPVCWNPALTGTRMAGNLSKEEKEREEGLWAWGQNWTFWLRGE